MTRDEKWIVAGILAALLLGLIVYNVRQRSQGRSDLPGSSLKSRSVSP